MKALLLLDFTGKVFSQKEKILYWLLSAFFVSLFLPEMPVINNTFIIAVVLHSCFYNTMEEKGRLLRARKEVMFMIIFYLLHIVSAFLSVNRQEAMVMLVRRLPLLIFPLCIGLLYIREELKDRILLSYCFFTTVAALTCAAFAWYEYRQSGDAGYLFSDRLTTAIRRESVYIGMVVNLALFTYVYLLQKQSFAIEYKGLVYLSIAFLLVFHYLLASHIAIITLYAGFLVFAAWYGLRKRRYLKGAILTGALLVAAFLVIRSSPRTLESFQELSNTSYVYSNPGAAPDVPQTRDEWNGTNIRLAVWECGWQMLQGHWITGIPLGDKQDKLVEIYKQRQFNYAVESRRNMHNTYLDVLCNLGIIGLCIFLLGYLIFPLAGCYRTRDGLGLFIVLSFAIAMVPETWLDRSVGCVMLGFFFSLVSAWRTESR
ncbi:MAG TPA: O-antigen ligase family protein [Puia sp.]|jgi:O-antigen ligase|nr:O-antigen ligase family protein [Puia sp.]